MLTTIWSRTWPLVAIPKPATAIREVKIRKYSFFIFSPLYLFRSFIVITTASKLLFRKVRRLAHSPSKRGQMMRRGFRYEVTESNVKNVSRIRHLIWDFSYNRATAGASRRRRELFTFVRARQTFCAIFSIHSCEWSYLFPLAVHRRPRFVS